MFEKIKLNKIIKKIKNTNDIVKIEQLYNGLKDELKNNIELCDLIFQKDNKLLKILPLKYQLDKIKNEILLSSVLPNMSNAALSEFLSSNIFNTDILREYINCVPDFVKEYLLDNLNLLYDVSLSKYAKEIILEFFNKNNLLDKIITRNEILNNNELVNKILDKNNKLIELVPSDIKVNYCLSKVNWISGNVEYLNLFHYLNSKEKEYVFFEIINRKKNNISDNELKSLINEMDIELQKKIVLINFDFIKYCNKEIQLELFNNDNTLIKYLDENTRIEALNKVPNAIYDMKENITSYNMSFKDLKNINMSNISISEIIKSPIYNAKGSMLKIESEGGEYDMLFGINQYTKSQYDFFQKMSDIQIARLCMFDVNYILPIVNVNKDNILNAKSRIKNIFKLMYGEDIQKKYSDLIDDIFDNYHFDCLDNPNCILDSLKIVFNKDIIKNNSLEVVNKYVIDNISNVPNKELFNTIIKNAYGNVASEILKSRVNLNEHNINSLEIFNPLIVSKFGIGFIHDLISYNISNMSYFLSLTKDSKKLSNLFDLYELESNIYGKNISTFQRTLNDFDKMEELLNDIGNKELSEFELDSIFSLIVDRNYGGITRKEQLINYEDIVRDKLFSEIINIGDIDYIKEKICNAIFGISYNYVNNKERNDETAYSCLNLYNSSDAYNNDLFSMNEKIMLDFLDILIQEDDKKCVIELINNLFHEKNVLGSRDFVSAFYKIKNNQEQLLNDNLISISKLESELESKNHKVIKIYKNEVPIYILNGVEFGMLRHNIGNTNNKYIGNKINDDNSLENISKFEEQFGSSTISMWYTSNNNKYNGKDDNLECTLGFGYSKIPSNSIVGMDVGNGKSDISTDHASKLTTSFTKNGSINFDNIHNSSKREEVSMYRRLRNQELITNENLGGRFDFDYFCGNIYVSNLEKLEELNLNGNGFDIYAEAKKRHISIILINEYAYMNNRDYSKESEKEKGVSK